MEADTLFEQTNKQRNKKHENIQKYKSTTKQR